jgi:ribonuclease P protein component
LLPKTNKLHQDEVVKVLKQGKRTSCERYDLYSQVTVSAFQAAVIIPSRLKLKAVSRNRLKRRLFGALGFLTKQIGQQQLVIVVKDKQILMAKPISLTKSLSQDLNRLR